VIVLARHVSCCVRFCATVLKEHVEFARAVFKLVKDENMQLLDVRNNISNFLTSVCMQDEDVAESSGRR
jgi:hypothetical protein